MSKNIRQNSEYAKEILNVPKLSAEERTELFKQMKNGDEEARAKLIKHNMRLVLKIAHEFEKHIDLPEEDLISIGTFGLINAVDKFELDRGFQFSTLAFTAIKNAYLRHMQVSRYKLRNNNGRKDKSMQEPVFVGKEGDELTLESTIADDRADIDDLVEKLVKNQEVLKVLNILTKDERALLYLRHGVLDGNPLTLEEIGKMQGITKERVRQKEEDIILKLRHPKVTRRLKELY